MAEGEVLLDRILENTSFTEPLPVDEPSTPLLTFLEITSKSSPEPRTPEEEAIQPPECPFNPEED
jgi:hypothetical protein